MLQNVVFPYSFDSKQLPTGAGGRNVGTARVGARIVAAVHEKSVGLGPLFRNRERRPGVVADIRTVIDSAHVQRQKLIKAAPFTVVL